VNPVLGFDIETVPDITRLRRLDGIDGSIPERALPDPAFHLRHPNGGHDLLAHHPHMSPLPGLRTCVRTPSKGFPAC